MRLMPIFVFCVIPLGLPAQNPDLLLYFSEESGPPGSQVVVTCLFDNTSDLDVQGWSMPVCLDAENLQMISAVEGSTIPTINNGGPPDFLVINEFFPPDPPGAVEGIVISFQGSAVLPPGTGYELLDITVGLNGGESESGTLAYCSGVLGNPAYFLAFTIMGQTTTPLTVLGQVLIGTPFVRGDCNTDGVVDLADATFALGYLFSGGSPPACEKACDTNDDGVLDIVDGIYLTNHLFLAGPPPAAPWPECGVETSEDELGCESYPGCP